MTTLFCSNKLENFLGKTQVNSSLSKGENALGDWNGHLFTSNRKNYLIFVNNKSYYSVILENIKKTDIKNLEYIFINRLVCQLVHDKVIENSDSLVIVHKILPVTCSKTNNDKKTLGTLNDFVSQIKYGFNSSEWVNKKLTHINGYVNQTPTGAGKNESRRYGMPIQDMKDLINLI
ncbi:MAG: hypothetical protein M3Q58_08845 [Bacteroidota bacterium]|nr:hypothetical protein [Bacteroidota bacterium]